MKTKINNLLFSIILLATIFLFTKCVQGGDPPCPYAKTTDVNYYLSASNKANVYTGNDTLVFISNAGDTATLYGQGKKTTFDIITSGAPIGCGIPQYTYHNEDLALIFSGNNPELYKIEWHSYFYSSEAVEFSVNNYTSSPARAGFYDDPNNINSKVTIKGVDYKSFFSWDEQPHIYYNSQLGIIRVDSINGKNWTLNK